MNAWLLIVFLVVVLVVGAVILFIITNARGKGSSLNVDKYRKDWLGIERQLVKNQEASYHLCILNADKLLDQALRQLGYKGSTMGERLKSAQDKWSNRNNVWTAHKLRNKIAHESDVQISYDTTRRALAAFRQALKDVGAI
ncbi:TPA: hypothetical protein DIV49_00275 [Candidatus Saccharibacteria bacterium]|nr:hypothetical protein [Candidatus Saccharibacteria bacterium]HRJ91161.1 hypothetical protein [Candidatus Saccharibacteria bacterium]